jgi:DNA polymerase I
LKNGDVLLEWDSSQGAPPKPLLKDKFANERKKAKVMNFSIAYGKTVHGFMKDWNCSEEEARDTVALWYSDRPEVKLWQEKQHEIARTECYTRTLLGRERNLRKHFYFGKSNQKTKGREQAHGLRAAINTPV